MGSVRMIREYEAADTAKVSAASSASRHRLRGDLGGNGGRREAEGDGASVWSACRAQPLLVNLDFISAIFHT